jgi:hypothetical protein
MITEYEHQLVTNVMLNRYKSTATALQIYNLTAFALAFGYVQTLCGRGWRGEGTGSFNWGALAEGTTYTHGIGTFQVPGSLDRFKRYASATDGVDDMVDWLYSDVDMFINARDFKLDRFLDAYARRVGHCFMQRQFAITLYDILGAEDLS